MLSEEGGRSGPPLAKYGETMRDIIGLFFFSNYREDF